ncbi:MAG: cyclodeaminase/cyclohydrolase family protein, partial [Bacteroidales bacterium]|nr:cyclodeaminase/cyclohydrolase family protein [Bacteroidales bacterium]
IAFDEVCRKADTRGLRVTGSELVGLIPLMAILDAGKYFLEKQQRSLGVSDDELIKIAVKSMGLDDLHPFNAEEKIIEFVMAEKRTKKLVDLDLKVFINTVASELPAPGGGSVSAYMGAMGVALGTMVANLSSHKRGWDDRWREFSDRAEKGKELQRKLLDLVDEDTEAYNMIIEAGRLPKRTEEEIKNRKKAVQDAMKNAIMVPFRVMETAFRGFDLIKAMVREGNPASVTDAGTGALAILSSVRGAFLNVKINSAGLDDKAFAEDIISKGRDLEKEAIAETEGIMEIVDSKIIMQVKK